jgi:hypothetical protein
MTAQDVVDAVVGNRPGVKKIIGAAHNGVDAGLFVEVESRLGLQAFEHIEKHALKPLVPEIGFVPVLGDRTDCHFFSSHKTSPSFDR